MERFNISFKAVSGIERHLKRDSSIRGGRGEGCLFQSIPERFFNIGYLAADPVDTRSSLNQKGLARKEKWTVTLLCRARQSSMRGNFERIGGFIVRDNGQYFSKRFLNNTADRYYYYY